MFRCTAGFVGACGTAYGERSVSERQKVPLEVFPLAMAVRCLTGRHRIRFGQERVRRFFLQREKVTLTHFRTGSRMPALSLPEGDARGTLSNRQGANLGSEGTEPQAQTSAPRSDLVPL